MASTALLALDIDGVLKPSVPMSTSPRWVRVRSDWQGSFDIDFDLIKAINGLDVDIVWLTTWFEDAPEAFNGLIDAPVLRMPTQRHNSSWWKHQALRYYLDQHDYERVVWCDDDIATYNPPPLPVAELRISPHPLTGLAQRDIASITTWLAEPLPTTA